MPFAPDSTPAQISEEAWNAAQDARRAENRGPEDTLFICLDTIVGTLQIAMEYVFLRVFGPIMLPEKIKRPEKLYGKQPLTREKQSMMWPLLMQIDAQFGPWKEAHMEARDALATCELPLFRETTWEPRRNPDEKGASSRVNDGFANWLHEVKSRQMERIAAFFRNDQDHAGTYSGNIEAMCASCCAGAIYHYSVSQKLLRVPANPASQNVLPESGRFHSL